MAGNCAQCLHAIEERLGFESPLGETLCGGCYFAIWGVDGAAEISRSLELLQPSDPEPARPRRWAH